ncbi:hypothetical protein ACVW0B_001283 [Thermostichus sp. MS-CIW-23]|jgi:hypothetical protein
MITTGWDPTKPLDSIFLLRTANAMEIIIPESSQMMRMLLKGGQSKVLCLRQRNRTAVANEADTYAEYVCSGPFPLPEVLRQA